jgi:hypothetical protein
MAQFVGPALFSAGDFYVLGSETWGSDGKHYSYYTIRRAHQNLDTALTILEAVSKTIHLHEQEMQGHE